MVKNQIEFNNKYPKEKEEKQIKVREKSGFQGQLVIEDYLSLEKLYLRSVKSTDKIILKNLPKLQECTIWDCEAKDLIIENCPQVKKLDVENNSLTNLEFLKDLNNLKELKIDDNTKLVEILKPLQGDWEIYRKIKFVQGNNKDSQDIIKNLSSKLELSQQKYDELKKFLKGVMVSLSQDAKQELVNKLDRETKRKGSISSSGRTKELISNTRAVVESAKEIKKELENELVESKIKIQKLEEELKKLQNEDPRYQQLKESVEQKKKELIELKCTVIINNKLEEDDLEDVLEAKKIGNSKKLEKAKSTLKRLTQQKINEQEIDDLCQLQEEIIKLEIELGVKNEELFNRVQVNYNNIVNITNSTISAQDSNLVLGNNTFGDNANFEIEKQEAKVVEEKSAPKFTNFFKNKK